MGSMEFTKHELMVELAHMESEAVGRVVASRVTGESGDSWMDKMFGAYDLCLRMGWIDNGELIRMIDEFTERVDNAEQYVREARERGVKPPVKLSVISTPGEYPIVYQTGTRYERTAWAATAVEEEDGTCRMCTGTFTKEWHSRDDMRRFAGTNGWALE